MHSVSGRFVLRTVRPARARIVQRGEVPALDGRQQLPRLPRWLQLRVHGLISGLRMLGRNLRTGRRNQLLKLCRREVLRCQRHSLHSLRGRELPGGNWGGSLRRMRCRHRCRGERCHGLRPVHCWILCGDNGRFELRAVPFWPVPGIVGEIRVPQLRPGALLRVQRQHRSGSVQHGALRGGHEVVVLRRVRRRKVPKRDGVKHVRELPRWVELRLKRHGCCGRVQRGVLRPSARGDGLQLVRVGEVQRRRGARVRLVRVGAVSASHGRCVLRGLPRRVLLRVVGPVGGRRVRCRGVRVKWLLVVHGLLARALRPDREPCRVPGLSRGEVRQRRPGNVVRRLRRRVLAAA